jgi:hypothetical protein
MKERDMKKYASYEDFERDEYLRVKTFYENLEDIMDDELFSDYDQPLNSEGKTPKMIEELDF